MGASFHIIGTSSGLTAVLRCLEVWTFVLSKQFMARMGRIIFLRYDTIFSVSAFLKKKLKILMSEVSTSLLLMCDSGRAVHFATCLSN